jgi:hypothetical protein
VGDRDDLPLEHHGELQVTRLHDRIQLGEQLEESIEEIRRLMVKSKEEVVHKEKLDRGEHARATGEMK